MKKFLKRLGYLLLFLFIFLNVICAFQAYHFAYFYYNAPLENPQQMGFFEKEAAYDYVAATGDKNIVLWGASMGAVAITKTINDYASVEPSKVILEMPFATMLDAVEGRVRIMNLPDEPFGALLTFWGGTEMGTWLFTNKPEEYAKKITCPVLLQWGKKDPRVREKETDAVYANLGSAQKALVEYDNVGHESLCIHAHEKWMQSVTTFLNGNVDKNGW